MTPLKDSKSADASLLNFPLPLTITIISMAVAVAAAMWRIETRVSVITTSMEYERQLDTERSKALELRFNALEAKIESASLRNAAMAMSTEINRQNAKNQGR